MNREPRLALHAPDSPGTAAVRFGAKAFGRDFIVIGGPCSVEDEAGYLETARALKAAGVDGLRGGAFKPRTSPYDFQGLGLDGLKILAEARAETGLPVVAEILDPRDMDAGARHLDMVQVGSRNMQNFALLREAARIDKPILLKRGMQASFLEWMNAAEYVLAGGNPRVVLCERGIRTFETETRFTLDLSVVPLVIQKSRLPIVVDPSHGTGRASLVASMCLAGVAAGAHGLMVEVHPRPAQALTDAEQQYPLDQFPDLVRRIRALERSLSAAAPGPVPR